MEEGSAVVEIRPYQFGTKASVWANAFMPKVSAEPWHLTIQMAIYGSGRLSGKHRLKAEHSICARSCPEPFTLAGDGAE